MSASIKTSVRVWEKNGFFISTDSTLVPVDQLMTIFDSDDFYWAKALPEEETRAMLANSLCFGLYEGTADASETIAKSDRELVGFARCVTDFVTIVYLTDVWVKSSYQGRGLGKWLVRCVKEAVDSLPHLRRSMLFTADWDRSVPFYKEFMAMSVMESSHGNGLAVMECKGRGHPSYSSDGSVYSR